MRDGVRKTISVTPVPITVSNKIEGRIGVQDELDAAHVSVLGAFPRTFGVLGDFVKSTGGAISGLPQRGRPGSSRASPATPKARPAWSTSRGSAARSAPRAPSIGAITATLLLLIAELNLFVGLFNLLPLLPLDGGHVAILAFEEGRSRVYRLLRRAATRAASTS